jgi:hypothetical protein
MVVPCGVGAHGLRLGSASITGSDCVPASIEDVPMVVPCGVGAHGLRLGSR